MFKKVLINFVKVLAVILALTLLLGAYVFIENNTVTKNRYSVYSSKLPPIFDRYNIALITDFHNSNNVKQVLKRVEEINPRLIVMAGDSISMHDVEYDNTLELAEGLAEMAPVYLVSGNHETWSPNEEKFLTLVEEQGVNVLNNKTVEIHLENSSINLIGFKDIIYSDDKMRFDILNKQLESLYNKVKNKDLFNLLIFHRSNYFETLAKYPFDLVLSGHLHGGQINLPIIKTKILMERFQSTNYSKGYYRIGKKQLVVSGGLEKNYRYPRVFNTAEVVEVVLKHLK